MKGFACEARKGDLWWLDPDDIRIPEITGRERLPDLTGLMESIRNVGQLEPVSVRKDAEGRPVLVFGFSRVAAIKQLNAGKPIEERIKVKAILTICSEEEAFRVNIAENLARNDLTPLDCLCTIRVCMDRYGHNHAECARLHGRGIPWVRQILSLGSLSEAHRDALRAGELSLSAAVTLAQVPEEDRQAVLEEACAQESSEVGEAGGVEKKPVSKRPTVGRIVAAKEKLRPEEKPMKAPSLARVRGLVQEYEKMSKVCKVLGEYMRGERTEAEAGKRLLAVVNRGEA